MHDTSDSSGAEQPLTSELVGVLVQNHREFLGFLERRLGDRALAEDVLQDAFVRSMSKLDTLNDQESAVAWFYRILRNAVADHHRRRAARERKLDAFAAELDSDAPSTELHEAVCQCVQRLAGTLKPEYSEALRRVEVDGLSVKDYAAETGITSNNAAVRVFRAREALRKRVSRSCGTCADHGCLDCSCGSAPVRSS
jgi:RNA polymerase sigma factor (sigma-70 family)